MGKDKAQFTYLSNRAPGHKYRRGNLLGLKLNKAGGTARPDEAARAETGRTWEASEWLEGPGVGPGAFEVTLEEGP